MIPGKAREPEETYAYNLVQILRILDILPLLPKAVIATASFAGLREGELRGLEWPDYKSEMLAVNRSVWKGIVNQPKTRASRQPVPVIQKLARILDEYRASLPNPATGVMFHTGSGNRIDMGKLAQRVIRPAIKAIGLPWYGWHGFRRGIASNLYELGANERSCSGFSATPIRTLPRTAISKHLIPRCWRRCSGCRRHWTCWSRVQQ